MARLYSAGMAYVAAILSKGVSVSTKLYCCKHCGAEAFGSHNIENILAQPFSTSAGACEVRTYRWRCWNCRLINSLSVASSPEVPGTRV